jgi:hypothetical protein
LAKLAYVACVNEPGDVVFHIRPPEAKGDERFRREDHFVTDVVVRCSNNVKTTLRDSDDLVCSMRIFSPKFPRVYEEFGAISHEGSIVRFGEFGWS